MKKVLFIITGLEPGGAEAMLFKLVSTIDKTRFLPIVVSLTTEGVYGARYRSMGIELHAIGLAKNNGFLLKFWSLFLLIKHLAPDAVHTWMYHSDLIGGVLARLAGIKKVIWCIRNSDLDSDLDKWSTRAVVWACSKLSHVLPSLIVSCSHRATQIHIDKGYSRKKFCLIPNGFDLDAFRPSRQAYTDLRSQLKLAEQTKIVGLVARNHPQKNVKGFLYACNLILKELPQTHFVLLGKGLERDLFSSEIEVVDPGKRAQFHFLGVREDVAKYMAAFDVLGLTSSYGEAFPNVLGEAMACGVRCVTTDVGDAAEIVGKYGKVVPIGDMHGFAEAVTSLLRNSTTHELQESCRERILLNYEIQTVTQQYEALYR
jgi:glycosyltransferase involved in cell wall biosynthesis